MKPRTTPEYLYSLIPYASITTDQINNSVQGNKDHMPRTKRGTDLVEAKYLEANKSHYTDYPQNSKSHLVNQEELFDDDYNSISLKSSDLDITTDIGLEIGYIDITTAGTGYSAGTLTATGGGGGGFKGTYTVDSGVIDSVTILNRGSTLYTSLPTIVISDSGDGNAVLTPHLLPVPSLYSDMIRTNPCYTFALKDDLTYASTLTIDKNFTGLLTSTHKGLFIDLDKTGNSGGAQTVNNIGLDLDLNTNATTEGGTVNNRGLDIDIVGGTSGTQNNIGIDLDVDGADTNIGMLINTAGTHLKLVANADTDDYATMSVADTGDLTIGTTGDGTTDSDLTLAIDGDVYIKPAGSDLKIQTSSGYNRFHFSTSNSRLYIYEPIGSPADYLAMSVQENGVTSISSNDGAGTDADMHISADGDFSLNSATGKFILKNAATEFSVADSSYAGMILGYTTVGIDALADSYAVTASYAVTDSAHKVTFKAPPSGAVEIEVNFYVIATAQRYLALGLSDNATYAAIDFPNTADVTNEHTLGDIEIAAFATEFSHKWVVTGLTPNTAYTWYLGAKAEQAGRITMYWGGNSGGKFAPFIMKATALPTAVADYAVYG